MFSLASSDPTAFIKEFWAPLAEQYAELLGMPLKGAALVIAIIFQIYVAAFAV